MQTNLLGKLVCADDAGSKAEICAVYVNDRGELMLGVLNLESGAISTHPAHGFIQVLVKKNYYVGIHWLPAQKILTIKCVRELTGMDLKSAKEFVEASVGMVRVLTDLTIEEAEKAKKIIEANKLEATIGEK